MDKRIKGVVMNSEKVKEIKEKLQEEIFIANSFGDKLRKVPTKELENLLTLINELESENDTLHTNLCEYRRENKELGSIISIANEREYRKKFNDEWRKEYQKELDKQGKGHIAGFPDFDLVYKLYFEQKDRIAELENENETLRNAKVVYENVDYCYEDLKKAEKRIAELEKENETKTDTIANLLKKQEFYEKDKLKQFAERLKEKAIRRQEFVGELAIDDIEYVKTQDIDELLKEYKK